MTKQIDVKAIITHIIRGDGVNKCRICMGDTKDGQVHLEDTVMMDGDKAVTLSEILEVITGIEVESDEDLPTGLCSTCALNALNAANFRLLCHQAAHQWDIAIKLLHSLPSKNKNSLFAILENDQIVIIDNKSNSVSELISPNVIKDSIKSPPTHRCYECCKEFQHPVQLFYHLKESFNIQACYICGKIMSRTDLVLHTAEVHKCKVYSCDKCPSILLSYKQLIAHDAKSHSLYSHICVDCGRGFVSDYALHAHSTVHQAKTCPSCDKLFRNQPCYLYHVKHCCKLDKNRSDIYCNNNKLSVVVHNRKSDKKIKVGMNGSTSKRCICDYCGKTFAGKKFVAAHIQIVHLKNTHGPCLYCGKLLAAAHMSEHVKRHLSNHSYTCENCGIILKTKLGYIQHKRLHTGEKPYSCNVCGESFSASSRRSEHMRKTHNSKEVVLKHACNMCPARFRLPYRLQKHMHMVHKKPIVPVKQFACSDCPEKFETHRGLLHHYRRKHQVPELNKMKVDDVLSYPRGLCVQCSDIAISAYQFRNLVKQSENLWNNCINSLNGLPSIASSRSVYALLKDNLVLQTTSGFDGNAKDFLDHLMNRLIRKKDSDRKQRQPRNGPTCVCVDCGKTFLSPYYLNMHLRNSGQKEACWSCGVMVVRGQQMKDHLAMVHRTKTFLCNDCPMLFQSELDLKKHMKKAHGPGVLTCSDCGRTFQRKASFDLHSQMHMVRTCRACGVQFTNRGCYREHRSKCEPDAKPDLKSIPRNRRSNVRDPATFTCDYCLKTYHSRPQLKNHILWIHMDIRPHQCQWCGKRFYTPARLAEHSVVHTRERNFECDICGAKLVSKMAAVYHRRRHTGERPYECEDCGEKFISSSRRSEHAKRRHNKGYRIPCKECPASFVRSHELRKHIEKAHNLNADQILKVKKLKELDTLYI